MRLRWIVAVVAILVIAGIIIWQVVSSYGGDEDKFPDEVASQPMGNLVLDSVAIAQEGEVHEVAPGLFRNEVEDLARESGSAVAILRYTNEDSDPAAGVTI